MGETTLYILHLSMFWNCSNLKSVEIPNSVTTIDDYAFYGCGQLSSITMPASIAIKGSPFIGSCKEVAYLKLTGSGSMSTDASYPCRAYTNVGSEMTVVIENGVTSIPGGAFSGCNNLISIFVPESVTSIGAGAFAGCDSLTSAGPDNTYSYQFGWTTEIPDNAFSCASLLNITLPETIVRIGSSAFAGSGVSKILIPNNTQYIGAAAFSGCSNLIGISIPSKVVAISDNLFASCNKLSYVVSAQ